jgi:hypothetical protein
MNCHDFEKWLQSCLDGEQSLFASGSASDHARTCAPCRDLHAAALLLAQVVGHELLLMPPPGMTERIVRRVLQERRARIRVRWAAGLAAAAAIVMAIWLGYGLMPDQQPVAPIVEGPPPAPPAPVEPSIPLQAREATAAAIDLTRQVARSTMDQASVLMPPPDLLSTSQLTDRVEPDVEVEAVGKSVRNGLEPVTTSTRRAFDAWLNLLPTPGEQTKPGL